MRSVENNFRTVEGLITPADWDSTGNVTAIKISAPGEIDYFVIRDAIGNQLSEHLKKWIVAEGQIEIESNRNLIKITSFNLEARNEYI